MEDRPVASIELETHTHDAFDDCSTLSSKTGSKINIFISPNKKKESTESEITPPLQNISINKLKYCMKVPTNKK